MRFAFLSAVMLTSLVSAQDQASSQTARQALIEMFFGAGAGHLEKHLPDATKNTLKKLGSANGMSALDEFSALASQVKAGGNKFETFDTGSTLLKGEDPQGENVEITVERDDLSGDEDQIEVALHVTKDAKEQALSFVPRVTFVMKSEADVWRLSEILFTLKIPLADPDFLKSLEDRQRSQNEQFALWGMHSIISAESYTHSRRGTFACSLSELARVSSMSPDGKSPAASLLGADLASGKSNNYIFAISGCDGNKYKLAAEPAVPDSGQRALCADETGTIRASADGKATSCVQSGEPIQDPLATQVSLALPAQSSTPVQPRKMPVSGVVGDQPGSVQAPGQPQRVRVSEGVSRSMIVAKVQPIYPPEAKAARVQGTVVLGAVIGKDGGVRSLRVVTSPSTLLDEPAMDAVQQWKYRPYLLNGVPVEVDTQITVNFVLSAR